MGLRNKLKNLGHTFFVDLHHFVGTDHGLFVVQYYDLRLKTFNVKNGAYTGRGVRGLLIPLHELQIFKNVKGFPPTAS